MTNLNISLRKISNGFILSVATTEVFAADTAAVATEVARIVENFDATVDELRVTMDEQRKADAVRAHQQAQWQIHGVGWQTNSLLGAQRQADCQGQNYYSPLGNNQ